MCVFVCVQVCVLQVWASSIYQKTYTYSIIRVMKVMLH